MYWCVTKKKVPTIIAIDLSMELAYNAEYDKYILFMRRIVNNFLPATAYLSEIPNNLAWHGSGV